MPLEEVSAEVLSYLMRRPYMEDSLNGIVNWCVHSNGSHYWEIGEIRSALKLLVRQGYIKVGKKDGNFTFKVKRLKSKKVL